MRVDPLSVQHCVKKQLIRLITLGKKAFGVTMPRLKAWQRAIQFVYRLFSIFVSISSHEVVCLATRPLIAHATYCIIVSYSYGAN